MKGALNHIFALQNAMCMNRNDSYVECVPRFCPSRWQVQLKILLTIFSSALQDKGITVLDNNETYVGTFTVRPRPVRLESSRHTITDDLLHMRRKFIG